MTVENDPAAADAMLAALEKKRAALDAYEVPAGLGHWGRLLAVGAADKEFMDCMDVMVETPAGTLGGVLTKFRALVSFVNPDHYRLEGRMMTSLLRDLERLAAEPASGVAVPASPLR